MKTTIRRLIDCAFGLIGMTLLLGTFFEDEHRSFEGTAVTAGFTGICIFFSLLFIGTLKLAGIERGGVYGMAHGFAEWLYPTPWSPIFRVLSLPLALGLGSALGGLLHGGEFSTHGFAAALGSSSALLLAWWFRNRLLKTQERATTSNPIPD